MATRLQALSDDDLHNGLDRTLACDTAEDLAAKAAKLDEQRRRAQLKAAGRHSIGASGDRAGSGRHAVAGRDSGPRTRARRAASKVPSGIGVGGGVHRSMVGRGAWC